MGFEDDCPSAAYELVIESITDCAFSCPISDITILEFVVFYSWGKWTDVDSNRQRFEGGYDRYYGLSGRSSSHALSKHRSNHLQMISMSFDSCNGDLVRTCPLVAKSGNSQKTVPKVSTEQKANRIGQYVTFGHLEACWIAQTVVRPLEVFNLE